MRILIGVLALAACSSGTAPEDGWLRRQANGITVEYRAIDEDIATQMFMHAEWGRVSIENFFSIRGPATFTARVYPDRASLANFFELNHPDTEHECWMVASANAREIVMLSPRLWATDACGHDGTNAMHVRQVITHEVVHVFHHQRNPDPIRLQVEAEWFEEGVAVLVSGQLDAAARSAVKQFVQNGFAPTTLAQALSLSPNAYATAGSLVDYIHATHGVGQLLTLLGEDRSSGLFTRLGTTESALLSAWRQFVLTY